MGTRLPLPLDLSVTLLDALFAAGAEGAKEVRSRYKRHRRPAHTPAHCPGTETPMWNALVASLRLELSNRGTQARLARYLGLPRQRIHEFLKSHQRLPDAETTLRLLHWVSARQSGRDPSL
jgi:hypothetical protein